MTSTPAVTGPTSAHAWTPISCTATASVVSCRPTSCSSSRPKLIVVVVVVVVVVPPVIVISSVGNLKPAVCQKIATFCPITLNVLTHVLAGRFLWFK